MSLPLAPARTRWRRLGWVAALTAGALAATIAPTAAHAATAALPRVTISPFKGTPDASPTTQISFLGVPAGAISQVVVRGSLTGTHTGTFHPYSTGNGVSFMPIRAFIVGEAVTVTATETISGRRAPIGTAFTIGSPYAIPPPTGATGATGTTGATGSTGVPAPPPPGVIGTFATQSFHPPTVSVTAPAVDPNLGDIFLTPADGPSQAGAMIVNPAGQMVWFAPSPTGQQSADLRVQQYLGQSVLTYWQGKIVSGHGAGVGVIDDTSYKQIAQVQAGNGMQMDLHDFDLEPGGVALVTVYNPVHWNLSSVGGPANGIIEDCVIQEIDVRTGLVMLEWHALGHIPLSASYVKPQPWTTAVWDWFHVNSIDLEANQNILISARNTWSVYQIGHTFGEVLWALGGKSSSFKLGPNVRFAWQHDATRLRDGSVQIFDNESTPPIAKTSRGIDIGLNFHTHTATLLHQWVDPQQTVLSPSQGDVQQLANTDSLVGFGQIGLVSEFSPAGALTFRLVLPPLVESYRAYRFPWIATPSVAPVAAASRGAGGATTTVAASWNGATTVAGWEVLAGPSPNALGALGVVVRPTGFETQISAATTAQYVAVSAIGSDGKVLGTSAAVAVGAAAA